MLITCYQCRRQLEAPDDAAGQRAQCPHCQYVIVVPAMETATPAVEGSIQTPALGLPSMELDTAAQKPTTTKVPAQPLPPLELPPAAPPPAEEQSDLPPSDHGARRRRVPIGSSAPASPFRWGHLMLVGCVLFGLVVFGLLRAFMEPQPEFELPPFAVQIDENQRPPGFGVPPLENQFQPGVGPFAAQVGVALPWQEYYNSAHRFKVRFPGPVAQKNRVIAGKGMTVFEAKHGAWEFSVAQRDLSDEEFKALPLAQHFKGIRTALGILADDGIPLSLSGLHPGREWSNFGLPQAYFAQAFFVRAEAGYAQYVLEAKGPAGMPRQDPGFAVFFNNFFALPGLAGDNAHVGQTVFEESDDAMNGQRRVNEFTALALHPGQPIAVVGSAAGQGRLLGAGDLERHIRTRDGQAIEQLAISSDGAALAVAAGGVIHVQPHRHGDFKNDDYQQRGLRCLFTRDRRLLILTADGISLLAQATGKQLGVMPFPAQSVNPKTVQGLALSSDERTLAVFDDQAIALWQWPEQKLLHRFDAQAVPLTAVALSADGTTLAGGTTDGAIRIWDVAARKERATLRQHAWSVAALAITPDGKRLASAGLDGMLLLWDLEPALPKLIWAQANRFPVRAAAFDADGKHCYLTCKLARQADQGGRDYVRQLRKIALADMKPNPEQAERIVAQCAGLHLPVDAGTVSIGRDGKTIVTSSDPGFDDFNRRMLIQVSIWDGMTGRRRDVWSAAPGSVLSPDGKWLAFSRPGPNASIRLMDTATLKTSAILVRRDADFLDNVFFTPDSRSLWILDKHELLRFSELDRLPLDQPDEGAHNRFDKLRVSLKDPADPRNIDIAVALDQQSFLVSLTSPNGGFRKRTLHAMADGKLLPLPKWTPGERSQFLRLRKLDVDSIELEDSLRGHAEVIGRQWHYMAVSAIHPNGALAVAEATEQHEVLKLHLWDLKERRPLLTLPDAAARLAHAVRFSADGRFIGCATNAGWTRITPTDWLLARKALLHCNPDEAATP